LHDFVVHSLINDVLALHAVELIIMPLYDQLALYAQGIECVIVANYDERIKVTSSRRIPLGVSLRLEVVVVTLNIAGVDEDCVWIHSF
jgi:hypothetical protein